MALAMSATVPLPRRARPGRTAAIGEAPALALSWPPVYTRAEGDSMDDAAGQFLDLIHSLEEVRDAMTPEARPCRVRRDDSAGLLEEMARPVCMGWLAVEDAVRGAGLGYPALTTTLSLDEVGGQ